MSQINPKGNSTATGVYFKDGPNIDAFGRLRVSNPMTVLHEGWASASIRLARSDLESQLRLGTSIAGVRDVLVLAVSPISSNSDLRFAVNIHEVL